MSQKSFLDHIEEINISLKAKSKTGRYLGPQALKNIIRTCDGNLFYDPDGDTYLLRTARQDLENDRHIVIIFALNGQTAHVITQSKEHGREWSRYTYIHTKEILEETLTNTDPD